MTLDQWFQTYKGQSLLVGTTDESLRGQCFMAFDSVLHDVYHQPYFYAPAAIDIWETPGVLLENFDKIPFSQPMAVLKGDIVVYGVGVGTPDGHVSIVAQDGGGSNYIGYDSNWGDSKILQQITHNDTYNQYILGVLRWKGGDTMNAELAKDIYLGFLHRQAAASEYEPWVGKDPQALVNAILQSAEWLTQNDILLVEYPKFQQELANIQQLKPGVYRV